MNKITIVVHGGATPDPEFIKKRYSRLKQGLFLWSAKGFSWHHRCVTHLYV